MIPNHWNAIERDGPVMSELELTEQTSDAETGTDELADLDDIDFDLDEVENKIAPLALAFAETRSW